MPIMDGRTAANEIRKLEATVPCPDDIDPLRCDGRIPIFAVSASLYESDRSNLSEHFDGWLLKPLGESENCVVTGKGKGIYADCAQTSIESDRCCKA